MISREPGLREVFDRQLLLQTQSMGVDLIALNDEARVDYIRTMILALEDELHEALAEVGWKPWATNRSINREAFGNELVDALHFLVNLFLVAGWSHHDVIDAYFEKADRNAKRQADGYDGRTGDCGCQRVGAGRVRVDPGLTKDTPDTQWTGGRGRVGGVCLD